MTDLDRKIAELKGWKRPEWEKDFPFEPGDGLYSAGGTLEYIEGQEAPMWSQDIAKAFELVDEVCGPRADRLKPISFSIICAEPNGWVKRVKFFQWKNNRITQEWNGDGWSIQEAICRAYIALKEWEGKK